MTKIDYTALTPDERKAFIDTHYNQKRISFEEMAEISNTYSQKIRRDAVKFGIPIRSRAEAQSLALESGRHKHPTEGTTRDPETKKKIGEKMSAAWDNFSDEQRAKMVEYGRQSWNNRTEIDKKRTQDKARKSILQAAKTGSMLEKSLAKGLIENGYFVELHKVNIISREKLEIDILLPQNKIAIEVDGPSHCDSKIFGEKALNRSQRSDKAKTGLILAAGFVLIRVKNYKTPSQHKQRQLLQRLLEEIKKIEKEFPEPDKRCIIIGEENES